MFGFVYITTNMVNGKKYIGQCRYGKKGWATYLGSGKALKRAVKKYGRDAFTRTIIEECEDRDKMIERENHYLDKYDAANNPDFYNIQPTAYASKGFTGRKHTKERNEKMSKRFKGKKRTEINHWIKGVTAANAATRGIKRSEHTKQLMSETNHRRTEVIIDGITFHSMSKAFSHFSHVSKHTVRKWIKTGISRQPGKGSSKMVKFDGVIYESIVAAMNETGRSRGYIKKHGTIHQP